MNKLFVPFLPPWAETGLQPAFYDVESGTVLQQVSRMYAKVNQLIRNFNDLSKETKDTVEEYIAKFVELKDFVDDYFDNLDVQEEINNKLDEMTEDGTLEEIIGHYIQRPATKESLGTVQIGHDISVDENGVIDVDFDKMYFYAIPKSSATYVGKLPNGKNILIDTGKLSEWVDVKAGIDSLGITKFDVIIITHFHNDHDGNIQNIINNYDCSDATWYIGAKPDFINHNGDIEDGQETLYDNGIALLASNNISPVIPTDKQIITVDEEHDVTIQFFNTSTANFETYYGRIGEYRTSKINLNDFSLFGFITHRNVKIMFGGDIERPVEDAYANEMSKVNLLLAPHHCTNIDANRKFYEALRPDVTVALAQLNSPNWIKSFYRQFGYIYETGSDFVTTYGNSSYNDIFEFVSTGYELVNLVKSSPFTQTWYNYDSIYEDFRSCIDVTITPKSEATLESICRNLPEGYTIRQKLTADILSDYTQLVSDLTEMFPLFVNTMWLTITHIVDYGWEIKVNTDLIEFKCLTNLNYTQFFKSGNGCINTIATPATLDSTIVKLPVGHYTTNYYQDTTGDVLTHAYSYAGIIDVTLVDSNGVSANVLFSVRNKNITAGSTIMALGYWRQSESGMELRKIA